MKQKFHAKNLLTLIVLLQCFAAHLSANAIAYSKEGSITPYSQPFLTGNIAQLNTNGYYNKEQELACLPSQAAISFNNGQNNNKPINVYVEPNLTDAQSLWQDTGAENVLHVFSHGRAGELLLGGEWRNAAQIANWLGNTTLLNDKQHLNIYGCEFAKGTKGQAAVAYLEKELGVSIAASTNITGRDGDWTLEMGQPLAAISLPNYQGNLQTTPPMNFNQNVNNYNVCLKLGFTDNCYATIGGGGDDIAVNANGVIALDGGFSHYNYMNANGTVTAHTAPLYGFLNSDFTYNTSFTPAYSPTLDDTTRSTGCAYARYKQFMSSTYDSCFIYNYYNGSNKVYKVCGTGRTLLYSTASINILAMTTSKLGEYFFAEERVGTNGPYVIKKISTADGGIDATFTYSNATNSVSQILEAPDGKIYIIEAPNSTLKRLTSTGAVDASFAPHTSIAYAALQSTGKVVASGIYTNTTSLTRYNTDGSVDATFNILTDVFGKAYTGTGPYAITATRAYISKMQINANDEIYVMGSFNEINGYYTNGLAKLSANGVYNNAFRLNLRGGARVAGGINDILLQSDGKLLVALHFGEFGWNNLFQAGLVRLLPNGKLDTPINNTATNLDAKVPTAGDLLISLQSMGGANSPVLSYNFEDAANFNLPGYNANPNLNADTISGTHGVSELEYSLANNLYYKASGNLLTAFKTTDASITGKADVEWSVVLPAPTNGYFVYDLQVSADGKYLAVNQGIFDASIYDAKTGTLLNGTLNPGGYSMAYQPISPNYLFALSGYNGVSAGLKRYSATGTLPTTITFPSIGFPTSQARITFYSPVDFYVSDAQSIYKLKLVTSTTNLTPNPNGLNAIFDTSFGVGGRWSFGTTTTPSWQVNPEYDALTVGPDGTVYIKGDYTQCSGVGGGNVAAISPATNTINLNYIKMVSVSNSASSTFVAAQTDGFYNFALGQVGTCFTAPDITGSTHSNVCPATTADLTTLTDAGTLPIGSTLVWSMNNPPTSTSDTLSNLNVGAGTYYAYYLDHTYSCFGPADTLTVTITSPCPIIDTDGDGLPDTTDIDDDNDGISDVQENQLCGGATCDTDGDGTPDQIDLDSDNDGLLDVVEGGDANLDTNNDGVISNIESPDADGDGMADAAETTLAPDFDGDGNPDFQDLDSDNDGINDVIEGNHPDTNNDGLVDNPLVDTDNDGIADSVDGTDNGFGSAGGAPDAPDFDGDGSPDYNDLDSDNDGLNDVVEAGLPDPDGNGLVTNPLTDTDNDGIPDSVDGLPTFGDANSPALPNSDSNGNPDFRDLDSDNDGINDVVEAGLPDPDGDGLVTNPLTDTDNDGIPDSVDGAPTVFADSGSPTAPDTDGDGTPDYQEPNGTPITGTDTDGDGILDPVDGAVTTYGDAPDLDTDGDGLPDTTDIDDDNDGISDVQENQLCGGATCDTDGDGTPDQIDLDSDNDGLLDVVEGGDANLDTNNDGVISNIESPDADGDGMADAAETTLAPDFDGDGNPDFQDLDSDNDGINDVIEGNHPDTNNDGLVDNPLVDTDNDGIADSVDGTDNGFGSAGGAPNAPDFDGDGSPDYNDLDSDNDGLNDVVEAGLPDPDGNGLVTNPLTDTDNDGIPDSVDGLPGFGDANSPALPNSDSNGNPDFRDLDSDNDGINDVVEAGLPDPDGNGLVTNPLTDTDNDGIPDSVDGAPTVFADSGSPTAPDTDGDGTPDYQEPNGTPVTGTDTDGDGILDPVDGAPATYGDAPMTDTDGDGIPDTTDIDDDNDGISDVQENQLCGGATCDTDGDGTPDQIDLDSDNDGLLDVVEGGDANLDTNNDGVISNIESPDADGDGMADAAETTLAPDFDGDGNPDFQDLDSDNDGINDVIEGNHPDTNNDGLVDNPLVDTDNDGIADSVDGTDNGFGSAGGAPDAPDFDGDGSPDYNDLDSDNDGLNDVVEAGLPDPDGNGLVTNPLTDTDNDGIPDSVDGLPTFGDANSPALPNSDSNGNPDFRDLDSDNDGINDVVEAGLPDPDGNGLVDNPLTDTDNDGIPDSVDGAPTVFADSGSPTAPDTDGDGTPDYQEPNGTPVTGTDTDGDGILDPVDGAVTTYGDAPTAVKLSPKVFLMGAYNQTTSLMRDNLRACNLIPLAQPYSLPAYSDNAYSGTETTTAAVLAVTGNDAIVDWVLVELRSASNPATVVATRAALVQRDGDVVDVDGVSAVTFGSAAPASYYVAIKHRNHLGVMSATAQPLSTITTIVDFTVATTATYQLTGAAASAYPQKSFGTRRALWASNVQKETGIWRVIYQGPNNEVTPVYLKTLSAPGNTGFNANYILSGYLREDVNMDCNTIYQGPNNEIDVIYFEVMLHPENAGFNANFVINQQIP